MLDLPHNDTLVALMNTPSDWVIAKDFLWYRIPVKSAPDIVSSGALRYLAFYHTKNFEKERYSVRWVGEVASIEMATRKELFPGEPPGLKSNKTYYKINFLPLKHLPQPIVCKRMRRILFIPTTIEKLLATIEINQLFNNSPIENRLWEAFGKERIWAERQYRIPHGKTWFYLDFAIFCKERNINVECDGEQHQVEREAVQYDKQRSNILESEGWSVLRFTTLDLTKRIPHTVGLIKETINRHGGLQDPDRPDRFYRFYREDHRPPNWIVDPNSSIAR